LKLGLIFDHGWSKISANIDHERQIVKRFIDLHLIQWKDSKIRKPILLRGARQVGKTFAVRKLGETFKNFVEINFEKLPELKTVFDHDLVPERIIRDLIAILKKDITENETLLFFDEVQEAPKAIIALRYFYEEMPKLHVIAAGSLLDFAIQQVGVPVGRVSFLYMYPLSWLEFLKAQGNDLLIEHLLKNKAEKPLGSPIHEHTLNLLSEYLAVGGMPEAVSTWINNKNALECSKIHHTIIDTYRQDFNKYAKAHQIKYLELLFEHGVKQVGRKFKFSAIPGEYRKRDLLPALELLSTAGILKQIYHSSGHGIPLGAEVDLDKFKILFLDVGLTQTMLGFDFADWFIHSKQSFVNKGAILEAFVGQELMVYSDPNSKTSLYYWHKEEKGSQAEVDYLIQNHGQILPIEVKSNKGSRLTSLRLFLDSHSNSKYGIRFSTHDYSIFDSIHSYPLYAVFTALGLDNTTLIS